MNALEKPGFWITNRWLPVLGLGFCFAAFQAAGANTNTAPANNEAASGTPAENLVASPSTFTRWTCNAFYLPARNIWQRTVTVEYQGNAVRSVQIDNVVVYTFTVSGSSVLTGVDGERIQFDVAALTWTSELRGLVSSTGRCTT